MKKIIALQGRANSGKTTTIKLLPQMLIASGYKLISGLSQVHGSDFSDIFEKGSERVGVTSSGDTYDCVFDRLSDLVNAGCIVCICACRTSDRKPPGTIAAVNSFSGYLTHFEPKTIAITLANEPIANVKDARKLFSLI